MNGEILSEPQRVVDALLAVGWTEVGHSRHHKRLAWPDGRKGCSLVVPLDPTAPEYGEMMGAVLATLEQAMFDDQSAHQALHHVRPETYQ